MRILLVVLLLLAKAAWAEPRQFGTLLYDLPSDWTKGRERDGYVTLFSDLPNDRCASCTIYMATSAPSSGDLRDWLTGNMTRFVDEDDHDDITPIAPAETVTLNGRPAALVAVSVDRHIFVLAAVQAGDQAVLLGFQGEGRDAEDIEETLGTFASDVLPFWESLEILQPGESGLLPEATPGDLSGILWGVYFRLSVQFDGTGVMTPRHKRIVLYEDGHFYDGTAPEGTAGVDRRALLAAADTDNGDPATQSLIFRAGDSILVGNKFLNQD